MLLSLLDIAERSQRGPKMEDKAWNLNLFHKCMDIAKRFDIHVENDGTWFNYDDNLVDRAFEAGVVFLSEVGMYCLTTNRVINFTREEVLEACNEAQRQVLVGADRDRRLITKKEIESKVHPNRCPGHHAPFTEEYGPIVVKNTAMVPEGDYMEGFNFTKVDGREVFGLPLEAYAARREASLLREGVRRAGRQGMAIALYPINTRAAALIAPLDPDYGLRRTDGVMLSTLPDMKMEQDMLTAAIVCKDYGAFAVNGGGSESFGGFCGPVEGALIASVIKPIAGFLVYRHAWSYMASFGNTFGASRPKTVILDPYPRKVGSVVCQAIAKHTNIIGFCGANLLCGPGSETYLREIAVAVIANIVNGGNLCSFRQTKTDLPNYGQTPFEAQWASEVVDAALRVNLNRQTASDLLGKFIKTINGKPVEESQHIDACYDLIRHCIKPEWEEKYLKVKHDLTSLGLIFG